jgi:enediyne biosynthesis protein E4
MIKASLHAAIFLLIVAVLVACNSHSKRFKLLPAAYTGVSFSNILSENDEFNVFDFEYVYNGGGVAIGDINNDGLEDIFFTGNTVSSRLYINTGNLKFKDITTSAGVETNRWATGVTMADVNADGWLDIYVCVSGHADSALRHNLLFINNRDLTFTESALKFGLASTRYSTQAAFFDFDRDGDLDMYLMNHSNKDRDVTMLTPPVTDGRAYSTDQLFENQDGYFKDVSKEKGITIEGYGLGLTLADFNNDGWTDIYVANDYIFNDILYINKEGEYFRDESARWLRHTSHFSMGADAADLNNDGNADVMVADMMPPDNERQKKLSGPVSYNRYNLALKMGYRPAFMRNSLQINSGQSFQEIGIATGVHETDWSWSVLLADFDNNANKDIYVTNGYAKNITDRDFSVYTYTNRKGMVEKSKQRENLVSALLQLPGAELENVMFANAGGYSFKNVSNQWFEPTKSLSNGAAYADLDNDGDLDLVVNNLNAEAFILKNEAADNENFLQVELRGNSKNLFGEGTRLELYKGDKLWQQVTKHSTRGYQSSVSQVLHFGLSEINLVDVRVLWPDGRVQDIPEVSANQRIVLKYDDADLPVDEFIKKHPPLFTDITDSIGFSYFHNEREYDDFSFEPLLLSKQSITGPVVAVADVDGDGREDFFIGGATGKSSSIWLQKANRNWIRKDIEPSDAIFEDAAAAFFNANNDTLPDLYVVSGGNEFMGQMPYYQDRLYINKGNGNFEKGVLPNEVASGTCVAVADYDKDGDEDLFVGGGGYPQRYPLPDKSFLLNNQNGRMERISLGGEDQNIERLGVIRAAAWADVNNDSWQDLVVVGDFMPLTIYQNNEGKSFTDITNKTGVNQLTGMWQAIFPFDFDKDGDVDFALGNYGLNTAIKGTIDEPFFCRAVDIEGNGSLDPVYSRFIDGQEWPFASRDQLLEQVPSLKKKFTTHKAYAMAQPRHILGDKFETAYTLAITENRSGIMINTPNGFVFSPFDFRAQWSSINDFLPMDVNKDGWVDLLTGGNRIFQEATYGPLDAATSIQVLISQSGKSFTSLPQQEFGFINPGMLKKFQKIRIQGFCDAIVCFNATDSIKAFKN